MGDCTKIHSVGLKQEFEEASKKRDYYIEEEVVSYLQGFIADNERKIEAAKKRLTLTQESPGLEEKVNNHLFCSYKPFVTGHSDCMSMRVHMRPTVRQRDATL